MFSTSKFCHFQKQRQFYEVKKMLLPVNLFEHRSTGTEWETVLRSQAANTQVQRMQDNFLRAVARGDGRVNSQPWQW